MSFIAGVQSQLLRSLVKHPQYFYRVAALPLTSSPQEDHAEENKVATESLGVMTGLSCYKDGTDPVIMSDSEYPDWLWDLVKSKDQLEDIPKTEKRYWRRLNRDKIKKQNMIRKQQKF